MNSDEPEQWQNIFVLALEPEQWQYISVLIATDIRDDRADGLDDLADMHLKIWEKIQPLCRWDELYLEDEE